jgi:MFS family permease
MGYPSPVVPQMQAEWGKSALSDFQWTFFNSITALSAIIGPFFTKLLLIPRFKLGRRISCFIIAVVGTGSWLILLGNAQNRFWVGMIARALLGVVIGAFSALCPMYIVELAPADMTGFFGSLAQLSIASGIVVVYLVGSWISWKYNAVVGAVICGLLCVLVWFVPESPATAQELEAAEEQNSHAANGDDETKESIFSSPHFGRLLAGIAFMFFQQFSGINAILTNLTELFTQAGVELESGYASTITGAAQVIACLCAGFLIEKLGRRVVWIISFSLITLTDLLYGISNIPSLRESNTFPNWFPILVIFVNLLGFGAGAGPIPWFIISEMFPSSVRATAVSIVSTSNWILAFAVLQLFPELVKGLQLWGCFVLYAALSLGGTIFGVFYVKNPTETGKDDDMAVQP